MPKTILICLCLLWLQQLSAQSSWYETGQPADLMISGVDFNQTDRWFNHPNGLATDGAHFLVCDRFNNRVLVWNSLPESWDDAPDLVLGQPDFSSNNPGTGKHQLNWVGNASLAPNGKLALADTENDRILLWNSFPTHNGQAADVSLFLPALGDPGAGQFYGWPWGVWTDGLRLAAVATTGGALLFWNTFPATDNVPPDYVIKLPQFGTPRNISTDGSTYFFVGDHNAKVTGKPGTFFWNTYPTAANQPYDFYRDEWIKGVKLPDGKLIAGGILSMYVWNTMPVSASQAPDLVLMPDFYKNGDGVDVVYANGRCFFNNYNGNNVLVYNTVPVSSGQAPDFALGSPSAAAQTLDSLAYVQNPVPVTDGQRLIVSSDFDRAMYVWDQFPQHSGQGYDHKFPATGNTQIWATTLHNNTLITGGRNALSVWSDAGLIHQPPTYTLVNQIGTALLDDIRGVALDGQYFYLATKAGKLYGWQGVPANTSQNPVFTLSSSSGGPFAYLYSDGEYLCAARPEPPSGVDIYRIADLAAGITTPYKVINSGQVRINQASHAVVRDGALAIASRGDHRVLLWKNSADWGTSANLVVLGQPDLNTFDAAIGIDRLFMPNALLPLERELWVGEFKFSSRILAYSYGVTDVSDPAQSTAEWARIFPNPTAGVCWLEWSAIPQEPVQIQILNACGQQLAVWEITPAGAQEIALSDYPVGLYFVRINGKNLRQMLRVIKTGNK
ncbi:MAG TPA: T9SS type A sorting domain-containing protein [Saprospiraceae bacterium]|nr:T9SS type A sorting domain-containing protein [Saprospiraceae bacterium]